MDVVNLVCNLRGWRIYFWSAALAVSVALQVVGIITVVLAFLGK